MISSQPQRRRLHAILDELEKDIIQRDDVVPSDLEHVKEHLNRILEAIHRRCGQQLDAIIARPTKPGSVGHDEPTNETLPTSRYEVETRRTARRDSGITRRPSEDGSARDEGPLAETQSKFTWVETVTDSLNQKREQIENHAKLPFHEQMKFDWFQDDARVIHCLASVPKGIEGQLRSMGARSFALEYEEWICSGTISEQTARKEAKNGDIPAFVNTLKVKQDDKKQVTTVIGAGRKMLILERAFGCSAISAVVAFVWRSFYRAGNEDISRLGSELQNGWLSQFAKKHQPCFDEGFHLYEKNVLRRKRQFSRSSFNESTAYKRARLDDVLGGWVEGDQGAFPNPTAMQSSQTADYLRNVATSESSGITQQTSKQTATAFSASIQRYADEEQANNCQLEMLTDEIEASIMPAPDPRWQYSSEVAVPTLNDMQWNNLTSEIEASIMSAPDPRWQCSTAGAVPALGNDGQWVTSGVEGHETQALTWSNDEWNLLSDELEISTMPGPGIIWP